MVFRAQNVFYRSPTPYEISIALPGFSFLYSFPESFKNDSKLGQLKTTQPINQSITNSILKTYTSVFPLLLIHHPKMNPNLVFGYQ